MFRIGKSERNKSGNSKVVWRDANGTIRCLGDDCPQKKCDDTCPIWLNTLAVSESALKEFDHAINTLEKAVQIAPDFYDAWNNMGAYWGQIGNYQKAYTCYHKAHELKPEKPNPVFGLALSSHDLHNYEECLTWCDKYDKLSGDGRCKDVRKKALSEQQIENDSAYSVPSPVEILMNLLPFGVQEGFILRDDTIPHIPEIMCQARTVGSRLLSELMKAFPDKYVVATPLWAAYAGIGAVRLWQDDWDSLKKKGIYESLVEPRGLDEMDEFVTDCIGLEYGSPQSDALLHHLRDVNLRASVALHSVGTSDYEKVSQGYFNSIMAMFYYGMIVEMHNLGMD